MVLRLLTGRVPGGGSAMAVVAKRSGGNKALYRDPFICSLLRPTTQHSVIKLFLPSDRFPTMAQSFDVVVLGGGNSAGYFADAWVKAGGSGKLAIVGDEPVSVWRGAHVTHFPCRPLVPSIS
jgi:hypothetical protein